MLSPWSSRWAVPLTPCCTCWRWPTRADVKLTIDDFSRIGKKVPVVADLKPSGKYLMSELVAVGGIQPDEDAAQGRFVARRLPDGDRKDHGAKLAR